MHATTDGYRFAMAGAPGTPMLAFLPGHRLRATHYLPFARRLVDHPASPFGQVAILDWKSDKYGTPVTREEFLRHGEEGLSALLDNGVPYWIGGHSAGGLLSLAVADHLQPEGVLLINHARPGIAPSRMILDALRGNLEETLDLPTLQSFILATVGATDYVARAITHPIAFYHSVSTISEMPYRTTVPPSTHVPIIAINTTHDRIFDPTRDPLQPTLRLLSEGNHNLPVRQPRATAELIIRALNKANRCDSLRVA